MWFLGLERESAVGLLFHLPGESEGCFSLILKPKEEGSKKTTFIFGGCLQEEGTGL